MRTKFFAAFAFLALGLFASPAVFAAPGTPVISTKTNISLPLKKNSKSAVCVNRNFNDTQKFGDALCAALDDYSFDCMIKLAEFVPKSAVVGYDYVWSFQVIQWTDKNLDDVPEKVKALVLLYDRDFNLLLKSSLKISKSKDPSAPNCLDFLVGEYVKGLFNDIVEVVQDVPAKEKPTKQKKAKKNEEQTE